MRKLILAWILAALSVGACVSLANKSEPTVFEKVCAQIEQDYGLSCKEAELAPPIIVQSEVVQYPYLGFYYLGERYIYVATDKNLKLWGVEKPAWHTIAHEMVHYILYWLEHEDGENRCGSEAAARKVTAKITGDPEDPNWRLRYGC